MPDIDPRFIKIAEEDLPCCDNSGICRAAPYERKEHYPNCPAYYRPIFAQRLQEQVEAERKRVVERSASLVEHGYAASYIRAYFSGKEVK